MKKLLLLPLILILACSPQDRFNRLVKKHPELVDTFTVINTDSFVYNDTVITKEYEDSFIITHDTIIKQGKVTVEKNGFRYKVRIDSDTLYIHDTIVRKIPVKGRVVTIKEKVFPTTGIVVILVLLTLLFWLTRKRT